MSADIVSPEIVDRPVELAAALANWVGARLRGEGRMPSSPPQCVLHGTPATGNSNVTLPFTIRWGANANQRLDLVLRMQRPTNQIFLDPDVLREQQTLSALAAEGRVPVPTPRWADPDPSVLGHPFFVMDRVPGTVPTGIPSLHATGWLADLQPAQRTEAWESGIQALGAVHSVDWQSHVPFLADGANGTTLAQRIAHATTWYQWVTQGRKFTVTDAALDYLQRNKPAETEQPVLLWGDARMGNMIFGDDRRVAAVLDWELASIGPAGIDLGWWLAFDTFTTSAHGVDRLAGYPDRDSTIQRYQALTGHAVEHVRWFEIYCAWVLTVTVIRMADIGVAAGRLRADTRMGEGNLTAQMLARWLDLPVPDLDPDYAARRGLAAVSPD